MSDSYLSDFPIALRRQLEAAVVDWLRLNPRARARRVTRYIESTLRVGLVLIYWNDYLTGVLLQDMRRRGLVRFHREPGNCGWVVCASTLERAPRAGGAS